MVQDGFSQQQSQLRILEKNLTQIHFRVAVPGSNQLVTQPGKRVLPNDMELRMVGHLRAELNDVQDMVAQFRITLALCGIPREAPLHVLEITVRSCFGEAVTRGVYGSASTIHHHIADKLLPIQARLCNRF